MDHNKKLFVSYSRIEWIGNIIMIPKKMLQSFVLSNVYIVMDNTNIEYSQTNTIKL